MFAEENFLIFFSINITFFIFYSWKKEFVLEDFYHRFSTDESKLHTRWTTAKVFICFSLELWLAFLFDISVEQVIFAIFFQSSKVHQ